ncbi:hypothetical protein KIN20_012091 [Parelaphostrongylus tenuis]|uniref:Uncharacterized protein n=1 Tax=Parelaphostrongylus tenuis TaxID=148309 RepID=A0AAD5QMN1_PARTN|nr:hypothetical protein KIN20_012091 [Parelaphostrongylus tenuis]
MAFAVRAVISALDPTRCGYEHHNCDHESYSGHAGELFGIAQLTDIVVDRRFTLAAVSSICHYPTGWRCHSSVDDTISNTECQCDERKFWHKCQMRSIPIEEIDVEK